MGQPTPARHAHAATNLKAAASVFLVVGGPVGWWIAYREAATGDYEQAAWLTGLGWLGAACLLAALGWRFPRFVGWLLIAVSPLLFAGHLFTWSFNSFWMEGWNDTNWGLSVFLAAAGTPLVAGILLILSARVR